MNIFDHINKQAALIALVIVLALAGAFFYYLGGSVGSTGVAEVNNNILNVALGKDLLTALARLRSTKLDTTIFADPIFVGLKDFGAAIAPQPVGRRNPFDLFGQGAAATTPSTSGGAAALPRKTTTTSSPSVSAPTTPPPSTAPSGFDLQ